MRDIFSLKKPVSLLIFLTLGMLIVSQPNAYANLSGPGGGTEVDLGTFTRFGEDYTIIGVGDQPIPVGFDPNGGNLKKSLGDFEENNQPLTITETFVVAQNSPPITDWHEEAFRSDNLFRGEWVSGQIELADGTMIQGSLGASQGSNVNDLIWFDWSDDMTLWQQPGDVFTITKVLQIASPVHSTVTLLEHPTSKCPSGYIGSPPECTPDMERTAVGGEIIPLDTTMVLLAGSQITAAWLIPGIVSAIGIGIVIARKF